MGSTSNALDKGGDNFKYLYNNSRASEKNKNNQTGIYLKKYQESLALSTAS